MYSKRNKSEKIKYFFKEKKIYKMTLEKHIYWLYFGTQLACPCTQPQGEKHSVYNSVTHTPL